MIIEQGTKLRNAKVIDSTTEATLANSFIMAEANSVDTVSTENTDISSELAEIRENYTICNQNLVN